MKKIVWIILFVLPLAGHCQKAPFKFGEIPLDEMTMTIYDKDSSAAAVILMDYGQAFITVNTTEAVMNFERHTRIKILNNEGLVWANASILLFHSGSAEEKVNGLKASSFNLEGGKIVETKMSKDGVFKEKYDRDYIQQKFTLPNVKVGTVIEYTYKKTSQFFTNFPNWQFQHNIPTRLSEYWAMFPKIFQYQQYMQGYVPVASYEVSDKLMVGTEVNAHHWISKNIPAFKSEPFMTCEEDYVSKINFALAVIDHTTHIENVMGTWEKLNADLLEHDDFGKVINGSKFLKDQVEQLVAGLTDHVQKISVISDYIKQNVVWYGVEDFYSAPLDRKSVV